MASPIAIIPFAWSAPSPTQLPNTTVIDHYVLNLSDTTGKVVFTKTFPSSVTSYTTTAADAVPSGGPYGVAVAAFDAAGNSAVSQPVTFSPIPPVYRPPAFGVSVGPITFV